MKEVKNTPEICQKRYLSGNICDRRYFGSGLDNIAHGSIGFYGNVHHNVF